MGIRVSTTRFSWFAPFAMVWIAAADWYRVAQLADQPLPGGRRKKAMQSPRTCRLPAIELIQTRKIKEAKKELADILGSRKYKSLLPEGTPPPITINEKTMEKYRPLMAGFYKSNPAAK
jgi:hypothetical protein